MSMQRLGLFGGSFNPVHLGHLLVAEAAREELGLDRVFFIPATQSPFKPEISLAPAGLRLRMLRLALAGRPEFEVDDQEIRRGGISYTVNTVREYAARFPGLRLFCLIGGDHVSQLPRWREAADLARLADFVVIPRPGESLTALAAPFHGVALRGFPLGLSSSQVRDRVRAGLSVDFLVGTAVEEVIRNNRLYLGA